MSSSSTTTTFLTSTISYMTTTTITGTSTSPASTATSSSNAKSPEPHPFQGGTIALIILGVSALVAFIIMAVRQRYCPAARRRASKRSVQTIQPPPSPSPSPYIPLTDLSHVRRNSWPPYRGNNRLLRQLERRGENSTVRIGDLIDSEEAEESKRTEFPAG